MLFVYSTPLYESVAVLQLACCSCSAVKVCNVSLSTIVFSFFSFCLHISSLTACHLLNLIACAVATKTTTLTVGYFYALTSLTVTVRHYDALSLRSSLRTPSLALTGSSVSLPHSHCHNAFALFYRISLSLAVYLFILAANTFAFRFVPQLPKEREARSSRQLLYVFVHTFIRIMYYTHAYKSTA